jgi:regulator of nonsense transcripts 3
MKPPTAKLKLIVRRLPPGLTEDEFATILSDEWKVGNGKVDWFLYKPGKDSTE